MRWRYFPIGCIGTPAEKGLGWSGVAYFWEEPDVLDLNQSVIVIGEKGVTYEGYVMERASGDNGSAAYRIGLEGAGFEQQGQWHRSSDVFVPELRKEDAL
jgi:hypothetical protein